MRKTMSKREDRTGSGNDRSSDDFVGPIADVSADLVYLTESDSNRDRKEEG
jgi:hypothetical protein